MKKKLKLSEDSVDYEVGLVSGSLSKSGSGSGSSSLSALFSSTTTTTTTTTLFQPAPQIVKTVEPCEKPKSSSEVKVQIQKNVQVKETTAADLRVQTREQSLQAADEEEQQTSVRPRKRRLPQGNEHQQEKEEEERGPEFWVQHRQKLKANKQREQQRNSRTVFVGNLPLSCTKKTLRILFKDKGPIESIRFRSLVREDPSMSRRVAAIMRKAHPQKQSINAYVVFKDDQSATKALDRNGLEVEPDFFIRVDRVSVSASHNHKRSIFVGNLAFDLKELSLRRHFEDCGPVEGVRLIRDPQSGLGKGFGYVLFQSGDSVQLALKLDGSKLEGRPIRVKRSVQPDKLKTQAKTQGKTQGKTKTQGRTQAKTQGIGGKRRERNQTHPSKRPGTDKHKSGTFRGEMVDPTKKKQKQKKKKKVGKRKPRSKKTLHI